MLRRRGNWLVALGAVVLVAAPSAADAQIRTNQKLVTIAARECPTYESIRANRARNNIQESLKDLGPDTNYAAGEPLTAEREALQPQDACSRSRTGASRWGRAIRAARWPALGAPVDRHDPFGTQIVTKNDVPLLNNQGQQTPTARSRAP